MPDEEKQMETPETTTADQSQPSQGAAETSSSSGQPLEFADIGIDEAGGSVESEMSAQLASQIEGLKAQLEERSTQYMRIAADFDNFRKRTQKEKEDLEQQIKCATIVELLPVVDNFERARSQIKPQTDAEMNIHKSYQSVYKQLVDCLKRIGVAPMRAEGKEFDPNLHEAVLREPTDAYSEGTVIEELMRGYVLGERVLRHAMVKVAAAPEPVLTSDEDYQSATEA
jgi:molecular chaperone GrpE